MAKSSPAPRASLKQTELPLRTALTAEQSRPQCIISWDPLAEGEFDPNSRYPELNIEAGVRLHEYLHELLSRTLARWQALPNQAESVAEVLRSKDSCIHGIRLAHRKALRPGMDRSELSHATALCANAIRTITVLCNHLLDWSDSSTGGTATAQKETVFGLSRYFGGLRSYTSAQLPSGMLPFGSNRKITPIRREALNDPRILANIFAGDPTEVERKYALLLTRLKGPALAAHLHADADDDGGEDAIEEAMNNYRQSAY